MYVHVHECILYYVHVHSYIHVLCMCCYPQVFANIFLFTATNLTGVMYNYLAGLAQRRSFSEIKSFIKAASLIAEQQKKKVCTLWDYYDDGLDGNDGWVIFR